MDSDSYCGFLNPGWRNDCAACHDPYSPEHSDLVCSMYDIISESITVSTSMGGYPEDTFVELPDNLYPDKVPESWYYSAVALKYYDELKTMNYYASEEYAEGVEFGWYRTVRSLYPKITEIYQLDVIYDKWLIGPGRSLRGQNGTGIKDGTKAAIKAFKAYR